MCGNNGHILFGLFVHHTPVKSPKVGGDEAPVSPVEFLVVATNSPELRLYRSSDLSCRLLQGHTDTVLSLAKHPQLEGVFASSSRDGSVRVWHTTDEGDAVCVAVAGGHSESVTAIAMGVGEYQHTFQWLG